MEAYRLKSEQLRRRCRADRLPFETTAAAEELKDYVGQERAVSALRFGVGMGHEGYNIFAFGPAGMSRHTVVRRFLEERARDEAVPEDVCYAHNFEEAHKPRLLCLPAGVGAKLRHDMQRLAEELRSTLAAAFESEEYQARRQVVEQEFKGRSEEAFGALEDEAKKHGVAVVRTPVGVAFAPLKEDGVMPPEEFQELPEEERQRLEGVVEELQHSLRRTLSQMPRWEREMRDQVRQLNREVTSYAIGGLMEELRKRYAELENVRAYLEAVERDVIENARQILTSEEQGGGEGGAPALHPLNRYRVNLLVDHGDGDGGEEGDGGGDRAGGKGAPVIYEDNPTFQNLVGRVEYLSHMGALVTDFTLIKPGALHRANGGYLILDARRLLLQPYAWEGLKRALQSRGVRVESPAQALGLASTVSLEPEPMPLKVKVVLVGEPRLYYLLSQLEPEFEGLFKVAADFNPDMPRDDDGEGLYARLIAHLARKEELRPFHREAVARVIEEGARMAADGARLSMRVERLVDLLREADYQASEAAAETVAAEHVARAVEARIYRSDRVRERVQEEMLRGVLLVDTEGEAVGQVNGLSVLDLGTFAFGRPSRITARVRVGGGEVMNIDREVDLSGPIHSKGVLILAGFLGARYAGERPLSLSASIVFEQSYSGVDGDSASSTELYALLSAIAEVPLKQSLAVTGAVNQHGRVQAIGGANEKIEGFFDLCRARGLSGEQGVLIPASNVQHLMLRPDVVEAVEQGEFHVYAVETIDQGLEILTGLPAGEKDEAGEYPEGSLNRRVADRLARLAEQARKFRVADGDKGGGGGHG